MSPSTLSEGFDNVLELGEVHLMARDRFVNAPQLGLTEGPCCMHPVGGSLEISSFSIPMHYRFWPNLPFVDSQKSLSVPSARRI